MLKEGSSVGNVRLLREQNPLALSIYSPEFKDVIGAFWTCILNAWYQVREAEKWHIASVSYVGVVLQQSI